MFDDSHRGPQVLGNGTISSEQDVHLVQPSRDGDPIGFRADINECGQEELSVSLYFEPLSLHTGGTLIATVHAKSGPKIASVLFLKSDRFKTDVILYPGDSLRPETGCTFDVSSVSEGRVTRRIERRKSSVCHVGTVRSQHQTWISSLHVHHDPATNELVLLVGCSEAAMSFADGYGGLILFEFLQFRYHTELSGDDRPEKFDVVGTRTKNFRIYGQDSDRMTFL